MSGRTSVVIITAALVVACGSSRPEASATGGGVAAQVSIAVDTNRFPHAVHTGTRPEIANFQGRGLGCVDCHAAAAVREGKVSRPGTDQHAPCDACHADEFAKPPGALCRVCHSAVDPFRPGASPLQAYPERGASQVLASSFSHQLHLDVDRMEETTGSHVACGDCHVRDPQSRDPQVPGHAQCVRCHEQQEVVKTKLPMDACEGCHPQRNVELTRGRHFITGDLKFHHGTHETDAAGVPVACTTCHEGVASATSPKQMVVPSMLACATCHEDAQKSPARVRMSNCATCHAAIDAGEPPPSHGVTATGARPADHTLNFRKYHSDQAADPNAKCRFCHTEVTGAKEDSCFQCHEVMRPRDHTLLFSTDHGHDAQADSTRCATCHQPETCVACHSVPPRSHTPLAEFRLGGHAELARFELSSCLTCHTYEDTCSKCHREGR